MTTKHKYSNRAKISERKIRGFVKLFAIDLNASQITQLTNLNRNTVDRYLTAIRKEIFESCPIESPFNGEVEVDESFFGARRVKGKRGRGASGKTIVIGIIRRQGKVYTKIVPDCSKSTLQKVIRGRVSLDSVIHSDCLRGYKGLVDLGYKKCFRVSHGTNEFVNPKSHINGIESFWGFAKTRLSRFRGMHKSTFLLHPTECEFRFNNRDIDLYKLLLSLLRKNPLF